MSATIGQNIIRLREAAGFKTQTALAKAMSLPQPQVSDWENDRYDILDVRTLMRLRKALRVSIDEILEGIDPESEVSGQTHDSAQRVQRQNRPLATAPLSDDEHFSVPPETAAITAALAQANELVANLKVLVGDLLAPPGRQATAPRAIETRKLKAPGKRR